MTIVDLLNNALWLLSSIMLALGSFLVLIGGVGALRMPDLYTRMHAAGLTDSLGSIMVLGGLILQAGFSLEILKLFAILVFLLITGPTATYALANAAWMAGVKTLADRQEGDKGEW